MALQMIAVLATCALCQAGPVPGDPAAGEYELKAAFVFNFAKFIEWPQEAFPSATAPIVIAVLGNDSFRDILARAVGEKVVQGRRVVVRGWKRGEVGPGCQILFVSSSEEKATAEILQNIKRPGVLTIGEAEEFVQQGGIINLTLSDEKLRFEISQKNAESAGLKISSKLLGLAKTVWE